MLALTPGTRSTRKDTARLLKDAQRVDWEGRLPYQMVPQRVHADTKDILGGYHMGNSGP